MFLDKSSLVWQSILFNLVTFVSSITVVGLNFVNLPSTQKDIWRHRPRKRKKKRNRKKEKTRRRKLGREKERERENEMKVCSIKYQLMCQKYFGGQLLAFRSHSMSATSYKTRHKRNNMTKCIRNMFRGLYVDCTLISH